MLIERLQVKGLLSFGPDGINLPLESLNVVIGPNGSGKSNLLKVLELLKAAPTDLSARANETGNVRDWFWRPQSANLSAEVRTTIIVPTQQERVQHLLSITPLLERFEIRDERFINGSDDSSWLLARTDSSGKLFKTETNEQLGQFTANAGQSLLSAIKDDSIGEYLTTSSSDDIMPVLTLLILRTKYGAMQLHRNWIFGDSTPPRQEQSAELPSNVIVDQADNLANVLLTFSATDRERLNGYLSRFYEGIVGVSTPVRSGKVYLTLEEFGGREIPASRLSDGTLRYLALLTVLLQPNPPPLVGVEEPELGLHPDAIHDLAELLVEASQHTQLIVTTHSPTLIDALTDHPSSVVACGKDQGQTWFKRVDPKALTYWLDEHSLGEVWRMGGIGGNRW